MRTLAFAFVLASLLLGHSWQLAAQQVKAASVEPWLVRQSLQQKECQHWVDSVMATLSLKEKVGQLFIFTISPMDTKHNVDLLREVVATHKVGGLLYSSGEMPTQVSLTNRAQQWAKVPLMITFDGEWGLAMRLKGIPKFPRNWVLGCIRDNHLLYEYGKEVATFDGEWGLAMRLKGIPKFPRNWVLGCIRDNHLLYEYGKEVARQFRQIGVHVNFAPVADVNINPKNPVINTRSFGEDPEWVSEKVLAYASGLGVHVNFAPVADVNINPKNPVINTRSFGEDPEWVSEKVLAYASGLESGRVLSVCKHFPGHGDTDVDSHKALPVLPFTRERLDSVELYPFKKAIGSRVLSVCKHFPGHGDTDVDSHKALPVLPFTRERLDSVELYPFKKAIGSGLGGMMVGHLYVPALEDATGLPSSLSRSIVHDLLTEELGFRGLIFTDALAMKGVAGYDRVCLRALQAGNDMVLAPRNLKVEIPAVLKAVEKGELSVEEVERKCRKVLTYKYMLGIHAVKHLSLSGLEQRVVTPETHDLLRRLNEAAVVVLNNRNEVLPLYGDKEQTVALLEVGRPGATEVFASQLARYGKVKRFQVRSGQTENVYRRLRQSLAGYKRIVVAVSEDNVGPYAAFLSKLAPEVPLVYVFFTPGKTMTRVQQAVSRASSVVLGHTDAAEVQVRIADVLYGKATADGRLCASLGRLFPMGAGVTISPKTPVRAVPEEYGLSSSLLHKIDSIALDGIRQGAFPGCQVVVMKEGRVMFDKAFGTRVQQAVSRASSVVLGHTDAAEVQVRIADVLYGKATADGRLCASLGRLFPMGAGVTISPKTPVRAVPEEYGLSSSLLHKIDSIALDGIRQGAFPGCQVVVMKEGRVMFDKAFGTHGGKGTPSVESEHLYDLASLSKTTGTLLAVMKLYDKGRFNLTDRIADYLPFLQHTDKKNITIQELLYHQSGLPSWLS